MSFLQDRLAVFSHIFFCLLLYSLADLCLPRPVYTNGRVRAVPEGSFFHVQRWTEPWCRNNGKVIVHRRRYHGSNLAVSKYKLNFTSSVAMPISRVVKRLSTVFCDLPKL